MQPATESASSQQAQPKLLSWAERREGQETPGASPGPEAGLGGNSRHILQLAGPGKWDVSWIPSCFLVLHE